MKIAIVHDFLNVLGGAERVLKSISEIYPNAPIYTLFYNKKNMGDFLSDRKIITSSLQKKAELSKLLRFKHKLLFPLMPRAIEEFDFKDFDVVISSQSAWAKGIITKPETLHISYCHTPTRFLWTESASYVSQQKAGPIKRFVAKRLISKIRIWDRLAADRVDIWIANSLLTKKRIKKYYRRNAKVIYPPTDTQKFKSAGMRKDYFLVVSRLLPYKMVDTAVEAFNKLGLPLVIAGEGQQLDDLKKIAKENIKFKGYVSDKDLVKYYQEARAFVFPTFFEDFGLTPVEAMACGTPVIAAGIGGSQETVLDRKTGILYRKNTPASLENAVKLFLANEKNFNKEEIRLHAQKFSEENFKKNLKEFVEQSFRKENNESKS